MRVINFKTDDEYMTPKMAWENIIPFIPQEKVIWEPFYGDGKSGQFLRDLGCNVVHEPIDFFTSNEGEIIISNPPFSLKKQVFKRLHELQKPYILLLPIQTITKKYFTTYFKDKCQIIIPQKRIQFVKDGQQTSASWLDVIYLCYNMNLQKDIIYL